MVLPVRQRVNGTASGLETEAGEVRTPGPESDDRSFFGNAIKMC